MSERKSSIIIHENKESGALEMECQMEPQPEDNEQISESGLIAICIARLMDQGVIQSLIPFVCKDLLDQEKN